MSADATKRPLIYDLPVVSTEPLEGWTIRHLRELADVIGGATPDTAKAEYWSPPEIPWATPTDITACEGVKISSTERFISKLGLESCSAKVIPSNSCLMTSRATVGECRMNAVPMATNQGFASLVPKEDTDPLFLFYLVTHIKPTVVRLAAGTTYAEVSRTEIRRIRCRVPPSPEQKEIALMLGRSETAIAVMKSELAAAQRLKTALMQQLFTRGIPGRHSDFKVMRTFRKECEVPAAWDILKIAEVISDIYRYPTYYDIEYKASGVPEVRGELLQDDGTIDDNPAMLRYVSEETAAQFPRVKLDVGDTVLSVRGTLGKVGVVQESLRGGVITANLIRISPNRDKIIPEYLTKVFLNWWTQRQIDARSGLTTIKTITAPEIERILIPVPSRTEQVEVLRLIASANALVRNLKAKLMAVQRLKTSLLQNLLTGKVRVKMEN